MILNLLNGKRYIGSAVNLEGRRQGHFSALRKEAHHNIHFQRAFKKYGENAFGWEVLEYVEDPELLLSWEDIYLKMYWPTGLLYNQCPVAGSPMSGRFHTTKTKRKISKIHKGTHRSIETKQKNERALLKLWADEEYRQHQLDINPILQKGRDFSAETKQKMKEASAKRWGDPEQHQKASEAQSKRYEDPEQRRLASEFASKRLEDPKQRQKLSDSARKRWADPKQRQKAREAALERWSDEGYRQKQFEANSDPEIKQKRSEAQKGKELSTNHRCKISVSLKRYWARRKHAERLLVLVQLIEMLQMRLGRLTAAA